MIGPRVENVCLRILCKITKGPQLETKGGLASRMQTRLEPSKARPNICIVELELNSCEQARALSNLNELFII